MPSNLKALSNLKARLSRAKRRDPGNEPTITFSEAAAEIARALGIGPEIRTLVTLFLEQMGVELGQHRILTVTQILTR